MLRRLLVFTALLALPCAAQAQDFIGHTPPVLDPSDPRTMTYWDDFLFGNVVSIWAPTNCTVQSQTATDDRPGVIRCVTAASAVSSWVPGGVTQTIVDDMVSLRMDAMFDTGANVPDHRIGLASYALADPPTVGLYAEHMAADTNWFCVTRTGGAETRTDTGISFSSAYTSFEFTWAAGVATCSINKVRVSNTTNLPASGVAMTMFMALITHGTAANMYIDFYRLKLLTTRNAPG